MHGNRRRKEDKQTAHSQTHAQQASDRGTCRHMRRQTVKYSHFCAHHTGKEEAHQLEAYAFSFSRDALLNLDLSAQERMQERIMKRLSC